MIILHPDVSNGTHLFGADMTVFSPACRQSSCCWISSLVTGKDGDIRWGTTVSLTRRVDTGRLNNSPRSSQLPIVRLQQGCDNIIPIHTEDPDGDEVRCRWARGEECGGVCSAFPAELTTVDVRAENTYVSYRLRPLYV